ncbi:hypothetical protein [uncultured Jatrophihabitans sp.]|uniref:hypothetical protein n=1 Tax=uncultured Jatrophihabitans sp. TaxID=1610747 RepID=UPI0035CC3E34
MDTGKIDGIDRTADGRYIVIAGRRWRASDPALPEDLRIELVAELMAARRAVRTDPESARPRVQDAKVALGERGEPWWEASSAGGRAARRAAAARALARHRGVEPADCAVDAGCVVGDDRGGEHGAS